LFVRNLKDQRKRPGSLRVYALVSLQELTRSRSRTSS
jgi:hypothetical protein